MSYYYNFPHAYDAVESRTKFYPYSDNGGSIVALAGEDFAVVGADTRLSAQNSICTRKQNKLFKLSDQSVLGTTGCWADCVTLARIVQLRMLMYKDENNKTMPTPALAQMMTVTMYYKRFFPYYAQNIIAGLDEAGRGCVYSYDCIGHCERCTFHATGTAQVFLQPILDNQVGSLNIQNIKAKPLSKEKAITLLKDAFICAAERVTCVGDSVQVVTMAAGGIHEDTFALRRD